MVFNRPANAPERAIEPLSNNVECSYSLFFHFKWNINARALSTIFRNKSFRSILVHNYPFDVLFSVLLFQVKKQEIYREVNWPRPVAGGGGAAESRALINHGQRRHLWTPTDFRHHQGDIWNDENGLGIEFVTIVVWFRIRLSFNGNENQSALDAESISIRTNVLAASTFTFTCEKRQMRTAVLQIDAADPFHFIQGYKKFLKSICDNFSLVVILKSIKSCFTLHTRSAWRRQKPSCL